MPKSLKIPARLRRNQNVTRSRGDTKTRRRSTDFGKTVPKNAAKKSLHAAKNLTDCGTKNQLEGILTNRLSLDNPEYHLQKVGGRLVGNIISPTFRRKPDHKRQEMIWNALEDEFEKNSVRLVGMLLAYSPEEWNPESSLESSKRTRNQGVAPAYQDCASGRCGTVHRQCSQ